MEYRFLERITLHEDHVKNLRNIESADFKKLNRHQEVLPFKHSQVRIKFDDDGKFMSEDNRQLKQYVNANYINGLVRGIHEKSTIACQAPTETSLLRFWKMIWQNRIKLLVMLCPLKSKKNKKQDHQNEENKDDDWKEESSNYWYDLTQIGDKAHIDKEFTLKLLAVEQLSNRLLKRVYELNLTTDVISTDSGPLENEDRSALVVEHIQDCGWVDDTAENNEEALQTLDILLQKMQDHRDILKMNYESKVAPILVHCSAGFGRTGTLIALFNIIEAIRYTRANKQKLE